MLTKSNDRLPKLPHIPVHNLNKGRSAPPRSASRQLKIKMDSYRPDEERISARRDGLGLSSATFNRITHLGFLILLAEWERCLRLLRKLLVKNPPRKLVLLTHLACEIRPPFCLGEKIITRFFTLIDNL